MKHFALSSIVAVNFYLVSRKVIPVLFWSRPWKTVAVSSASKAKFEKIVFDSYTRTPNTHAPSVKYENVSCNFTFFNSLLAMADEELYRSLPHQFNIRFYQIRNKPHGEILIWEAVFKKALYECWDAFCCDVLKIPKKWNILCTSCSLWLRWIIGRRTTSNFNFILIVSRLEIVLNDS